MLSILASVPIFDGKDKNVKIEDWIREVEKAHILTDMPEKRIALQCSSGTPSTYIEKNLHETWPQMKKTLENWYARSVQPITHFFSLDCKPQRANEMLPDYIQQFMDSAERATKGK